MKTLSFVALLALALTASAGPELTTEDLKTELDTLRKQIAELKRTREIDLKYLGDRLDRIEALIQRLGASATPSTSRFTPASTTGRGTIRLENRMGVTGYVTLEGISYSVPALSTRTIRDLPIGSITYTLGGEGLATGPETRSRLNAGERLTITLLPPE